MTLFAVRRQPFKTLFLLNEVLLTVLVRTPWWIVIHALPSMRLKRGWSLKRSVLAKYRQLLSYLSMTFPGRLFDFPDHRALVPGQKGSWITPVPTELIVGRIRDMAAAVQVQPVSLPGYWIDREGSEVPIGTPPAPGEKVLFHLHGGVYVFLSANPQDITATCISRELMRRHASIGRTFSIEYRLTVTPDNEHVNPFPSQLIDALTGYYYLVNTVGFSPADIIVDGDSAGGNLALALTLYLVENQGLQFGDVKIPGPPGRLLLLSPWCDLSPVRATLGSSWAEFTNVDCIDGPLVQLFAEIFCKPFGLSEAEVNPYISPASTHPSLSISFKGFPRTFILCGGSEVFRDSIRVLRDRIMQDVGKEDVTYYEPSEGLHDILLEAWMEPERTDSLNIIEEWFRT